MISDGSIKSLILPSISIAIPIACISIRVLRAAVINELKSDYVTYAKARGFSTSKIVYGEVLRNAFPSAITLFAQYCASVFGTSALIETVFSIQGLGYYLTEACESMDVYGISGVVLICAILFVLNDARNSIYTNPALIVYPGICLIICCAGFNLLGEGIRDFIGKEDQISVS